MKKIEITLRKLLLNLFLFLSKNKNSLNNPNIPDNAKILFIRLNRIGDALVSTPLIKEIKNKNLRSIEKFSSKIYVLASDKNFVAFNNNPYIDEIIIYKKGIKNFFSLIKKINQINFDVVIDLHDDVSSTVSFLLSFIKSHYKFGFEKTNKKLFTHTVPRINPSQNHIVDRLLEIAKLFKINIDKENSNIIYVPLKSSVENTESFIKNNFTELKFLIGINISSGSKARFWRIDNFKRLINFLKHYSLNILILTSPDDLNLANEISQNEIPIFYSYNYDEFAAMISKIDLLFTPDTAIVHLASVFQIPVFGIYVKYKTNDMIWKPYKSDFDCVITEEPNLNNVSFDSLINSFKSFLEKNIYAKTNSIL
ncbi:MAG: glycosyltransferase family 9 protein [Ignavibacterium sp.]